MIIIIFVLWLLLNGRFTADAGMVQVCVTGLIVSGFSYFVAYKFLGITPAKELKFAKKLPLFVLYVLVLIKEVIVANFLMAKVIARKKENNEPEIVRVRIPLKTQWARVILANSITLTPGTITADFDGDVFTIHCIDSSFDAGIESSRFVKLLERLEK